MKEEEQELSGYVVKLHTSVFRGDHSSDVCRILSTNKATSVADLIGGAFPKTHRYVLPSGDDPHYDWIEIRPIYKKVPDAK